MSAQQQQQSKFVASIARLMAHALNTFYCRRALGSRVNQDTTGCVWTGEYDLNTPRVDGEIFESCGLKNIQICVDWAYNSTETCNTFFICLSVYDTMFSILVVNNVKKKWL